MSSSITLDPTNAQFPWTAAVLASHQGVPLEWAVGKAVEFEGKTDEKEVEELLVGRMRMGKEVRM